MLYIYADIHFFATHNRISNAKSELNRTKFVNSGNFTYLCGVNTHLSL